MFQLDIEHDNSTDTLRILSPDELGNENAPSLESLSTTRRLTKQPEWPDRAECVVYRDAWKDVEENLDETNDRLVIRENGSIIFGGRLADVETNGTTVSVIINSAKRDAIDAQPSGPNNIYQPQDDSAILTNELLPRVDTISEGTIETVTSGIAFSESHASPGKSITKLARDAGAEVVYRATETDFEIDYVGRLGTDRSGEVIAPGSATVISDPRIRENTRENVTHVIVLGSREGTAQVRAEAVAPSFNPSAERAVYRQRKDKDIQSNARAESLAQTLVDEYDGAREYLEVDCEVPTSLNPEIGDTFTVRLPENGIDTTLRVVTRERLVNQGGDRCRLVLSNRRHTKDLRGEQSRVELESLSEGNAGQIVRDSDNSGWDVVSPDTDVEFTFRPTSDILGEFESKLYIESRPYRAYSSGGDNNSPYNNVVEEFSSGNLTTVNDDGSWYTVASTDPPGGDSQALNVYFLITDRGLNGIDTAGMRVRLSLEFGNAGYYPRQTPNPQITLGTDDTQFPFFWSLPGNFLELGQIEVQVKFVAEGVGLSADVISQVFFDYVGTHTHPPSPGLSEFNNLEPSNVAVYIDDTQVASGLSPPLDDSFDVEGLLTGDSHTIRAESDSLGHLRLSVTQEALKNASGDPL